MYLLTAGDDAMGAETPDLPVPLDTPADGALENRNHGPRPRIGLALGSGVARGFAHIGVLRALMRHGIEPDIIAGTSIGAVAGGAYLANELDVLESWALSLNRGSMMSYIDFSARSGGLIKGDKLLALMQRHMGSWQIEALPKPFVAVATDMITGHEVWLRRGNMVHAMRASLSLPAVFPPVAHDGRWLIDGALVNPVPVSACRALGAELTIAVNLNADIIGKVRNAAENIPKAAGFDPLAEAAHLNWQMPEKEKRFSIGRIAKSFFGREPNHPSVFGVMVSTLNIVQDRITRSRLGGEPADVEIRPRLGEYGLMEFDKAEDLIKLGEQAVEQVLPDLQDALEVFGLRDRGDKAL
ncbi:MAG: patatin-like phospholipase family protein [Alphaproteobacteria bacterium]